MDSMLSRVPSENFTVVSADWAIVSGSSQNVFQDDDHVVVFVGNPHKRGSFDEAREGKDCAEILIASYRQHNLSFMSSISGPVTFVLFDKRKQRLVAGTDRIGIRHLYYSRTSDGIVLATDVEKLISHPMLKRTIDPQSVFDYVYFHAIPSPRTIYKDIAKLDPAQLLIYEDHQFAIEKYWMPEFLEAENADVDALAKEMLDVIFNSVRRSSSRGNIGAFLSGGLDSSTVAGMLAKAKPGKAKTYTIGFSVPGYDEMDFARTAASHFSTEPHEYYVTPDDVVSTVKTIAASYDEPFGNSSALPAYFCAKMAKQDGITRLLAGDGGDELFAGNERYVKQQVFELYHRLPTAVRKTVEWPFRLFPPLKKMPLVRKLDSYITQANIALPDRLETYNFLHRHAANEIFSSEFLREIDTTEPIRMLQKTYHEPVNADSLNRMLYLDWKRTLHDNDLVKVNRMCELAGVEVVYPLIDDQVVEFSLKIPSNLKIHKNNLRWFYKQAVTGFIPEKIINKSKHGFGLPFGVWTKEYMPLRELAYDNVLALKKRNYFLPSFLDNAIAMHREGHAAYYGELIWILMMFELWYSSHIDER